MMADALPRAAGKLTENAPLAPLVWFKSGGNAELLFEPADEADLTAFLRQLDPEVPVMARGQRSKTNARTRKGPRKTVAGKKGVKDMR